MWYPHNPPDLGLYKFLAYGICPLKGQTTVSLVTKTNRRSDDGDEDVGQTILG